MPAHPSFNNTAYELTDQMSDDQFASPDHVAESLGGTGFPPADSPRMDYLLGDFLSMDAFAGPSTPVIPSIASVDHPSCLAEGIGGMWFGLIHVFPRDINLGNILGTVQVTIDIFNADFVPHDYEDWTNNAGAGVSLNNPSFPHTLPSMNGLVLTLTVTPDGPPAVDSTLVYDFDSSSILVVQPISFTRLVPIVFPPERKIREELSWLTDVHRSVNGKEQRVSLRKNPRQLYDLGFFREDSLERQRLENLLFDWQARLFGLPIWTDVMYLAAPVGVGESSVSVDDTSFADMRDGGLAVIWDSEANYEVLNVDVVSAGSFTLSSTTTKAFSAGTQVYPLRTAFVESPPRIRRHPVGGANYRIRFLVSDNGANLADVSAFSAFDGKVLLDDPNFVREEVAESFDRSVQVFDGGTGLISQISLWDVSRRGSAKRFRPQNRQAMWQIRQLLHALRGRQVSFYLPTFARDLTPVTDLVSASTTLDVVNVGYSDFVGARQPKNIVRVVETDGTTTIRTVLSSAELSEDVERLTIDTGWPSNIAVADIERIDLVEKVRFDTDTMIIIHDDFQGRGTITVPVIAVLE